MSICLDVDSSAFRDSVSATMSLKIFVENCQIGKLWNCGAATAVTMSGLRAKVALTLFSELSKRCIVVLSLVQIVVPCYSYVHQHTSTVAFL